MTKTISIDVWSDVACPWCYLGERSLQRALANFPHAQDVQVTFHSYQLDPDVPADATGSELDYLVERKGLAAEQVEGMFAQIAERGRDVDIEYRFDRTVVANTRRAHRLLQAALREGGEAAQSSLLEALFAAHFEQGADVADDQTLVELARQAGLSAEQARAALDGEAEERAVADDIQRANELGITGVPFFVLQNAYALPGAQPAEVFERALEQVWQEGVARRVRPLRQ